MTKVQPKPAKAATEPVLQNYRPGDRIWCTVRRRLVPAQSYVPLDEPPKRKPRKGDDERELLTEKECTRCGAMLPLNAFYERETGRGGVTARCKDCLRHAAWKRYRTPEGKAAILAAGARYRASALGKATRAATSRKTAPSRKNLDALRDKLSRVFGSV